MPNNFMDRVWELYREYARYNKGKLLKEDTPADFLADIERSLDYLANPPVVEGDETFNAPHFVHLRKYLEIMNHDSI